MENKKPEQENSSNDQMMKAQEEKILKGRSNNRKKIVIWSVIIASIVILFATLLIVFLLPNEIRVILDSNVDNVTLSGAGEYKEGEKVTISAPEMSGYRFIGWEHNGEMVSTDHEYSFKLTDEQEGSFVAVYAELHSITISSDIVGGTITPSIIEAIEGEKVTLIVSEDLGYALVSITLLGTESEIVDEGNGNWSFTMGSEDVTVRANFVTVHAVSVDSSLNSAEASGTGSFHAGEEATISVDAVDGYRFMGWEYDGEIVSTELEYTFEVTGATAGNYTATFSELFDIVVSDTISNGEVTADKTEAILGEEVTIIVVPDTDYTITRVWYEENDQETEIEGSEGEYTFAMIAQNIIIFATFTQDSSIDRVDEDGNPDPEGQYILFGLYPQTIKSADVTVSDIPNEQGYYLGSDGELYEQVTVTFDVQNFQESGILGNFSDGSTPQQDATYYFKLEPLRWRILSEDPDGTMLIVCDTIVDMQIYQPYFKRTNLGDGNYYYATDAEGNILYDDEENPIFANNYEYSAIRSWLNNEFYDSAFTEEEKGYIITTTVDNSLESTMNLGGQYVCDDTTDNVFLLSLADVNNTDYTFIDTVYIAEGGGSFDDINLWDEKKSFDTTDYSIARGARTFTQTFIDENLKTMLDPDGEHYDEICAILDTFVGGGAAWLRSPLGVGDGHFAFVVLYGITVNSGVYDDDFGALPALQIHLN